MYYINIRKNKDKKVKISQVKLKNFRNYKDITLKLKDGLNIFVGNNAQGKTNLLESIFFCSLGKSPRTTKEKDLIFWDKDRAEIEINYSKKYTKSSVQIILTKTEKKTIKINKIPIKKIGELLGEVTVVYFSPDEIKLVKEAPFDRRRFMDIDISQISKNYFYLLLRYEKILEQRNKLLKETKDYNVLKNTISIWDEQLSDIASKIIWYRLDFINKLKEPANRIHKEITEEKENLILSYQGIYGKSIEETKQKLLDNYEKNLEKDFNLKYTTIGPHRDDIKIMVNDIDLRSFGSQGQQRLATLSIKISELELFKQEKNEEPILLLDDVLSELDEQRQRKFLGKIKGIQTILTCTKYNYKLRKEDSIFRIENGQIKE